MKIKGRKIEGRNIEIIAIPRSNGEDIIFQAGAVLDSKEFDMICPMPKPPQKMIRGGTLIYDFDHPTYKKEIEQYGRRRSTWMILQSLKYTPDLEWETVDLGNPDTWQNYEQELRDSGFSETEMTRIINGVMIANCVNEEKVEEARKRFLAGQAAAAISE